MKITLDVDDPRDAPMALERGLQWLRSNPDAYLTRASLGEMTDVWEPQHQQDGQPAGKPSYRVTIWGNHRHVRVRLWRELLTRR